MMQKHRREVSRKRTFNVFLAAVVLLVSMAFIVWYSYQNDGPSIRWVNKEYYPGGRLKLFEPRRLWADWKYTRKGKLVISVKHGKEIRWYPDGQKKLEWRFVKGKKHGKDMGWYENGQKSWETNFRYGKPKGTSFSWRKNGQKDSEVIYGKRYGEAVIVWYKNGKNKTTEESFLQGKRHGKSIWYDDRERVEYFTWYDMGRETTEEEFKKKHADFYADNYAGSVQDTSAGRSR